MPRLKVGAAAVASSSYPDRVAWALVDARILRSARVTVLTLAMG